GRVDVPLPERLPERVAGRGLDGTQFPAALAELHADEEPVVLGISGRGRSDPLPGPTLPGQLAGLRVHRVQVAVVRAGDYLPALHERRGVHPALLVADAVPPPLIPLEAGAEDEPRVAADVQRLATHHRGGLGRVVA